MTEQSLATAVAQAESFNRAVLDWFSKSGRKGLPWQQNPSPYRVWISEIMLQQTQVQTVIPYYLRFMAQYPDVAALADASVDQVLHLWTGLGYYARARNLHKAAKQVVQDHGGEFPRDVEALEALPGIGRSTAGAIAALSMHIKAPILDGNVKRVLTRYFAIAGFPESSAVKKQLWTVAGSLLPEREIAAYTQAMMDLGATLCTRSSPACQQCPLAADCQALASDRIAEFPGKKPKKALPVKAVNMLIVRNRSGHVLLEKRPDSGIWGGLYSLPEQAVNDAGANTEAGWLAHLETDLQVDSQTLEPMPTIRHSFTHYHLDITPLLVPEWELETADAAVADSDRWLWYPLDHSVEVGLAAPVKKLLTRLNLD
jgi:A/G-specific adenine glycosylase